MFINAGNTVDIQKLQKRRLIGYILDGRAGVDFAFGEIGSLILGAEVDGQRRDFIVIHTVGPSELNLLIPITPFRIGSSIN